MKIWQNFISLTGSRLKELREEYTLKVIHVAQDKATNIRCLEALNQCTSENKRFKKSFKQNVDNFYLFKFMFKDKQFDFHRVQVKDIDW